MENNPISLTSLQTHVDKWIKKYGVRYFHPLTNLAILTEEVGELAKCISRKFGEQSYKEEEKNMDLASEITDVLFVLVCIANQNNINLTDAFVENIKKKTKRDHQRHHNNPKLKTE